MKKNTGWGIFWLLAIAAIVIAAFVMTDGESSENINYGKVSEYFHEGKVVEFSVSKANKLTIKLENGEIYTHTLRDLTIFYYDFSELIEQQAADGIIKSYEYEAPTPTPGWLKFLPVIISILIVVVMWWLFFAKAGNNSGGGMGGIGRMNSFAKSRAKLGVDEKKKVLFSDVAGADEEKEELQEVVEFLKNPNKFSALGA